MFLKGAYMLTTQNKPEKPIVYKKRVPLFYSFTGLLWYACQDLYYTLTGRIFTDVDEETYRYSNPDLKNPGLGGYPKRIYRRVHFWWWFQGQKAEYIIGRLLPEPFYVEDIERCVCGNTPSDKGFYLCHDDGDIWPYVKTPPDYFLTWRPCVCAACGRIYDIDWGGGTFGQVIGKRKNLLRRLITRYQKYCSY
jgi:hypothetical protein